MRFILCTTSGREQFCNYLVARIPNLTVVMDKNRSGRDTFCRALAEAANEPTIYFQDDIILTRDFLTKAAERIFNYGHNRVHQFFSMRKADLTIGTRREPGSSFMMAQCFYLPESYSSDLLSFSSVWPGVAEHSCAIDIMIADFLKSRRDRYWLHVPSLVQHRNCVSMIDKRRSRSRQSKTFVDPDGE